VCVDTKILDVFPPPNHPLRNDVPTLFAHSEKLAEKMIEIMTKKGREQRPDNQIFRGRERLTKSWPLCLKG
jgi:hypothetical protein